ncbi:replication initiation protein [Hymenobacter rubripertinctus]|uniref:RepB family plasmid replication initiator protein n=1 Tax=Hymenobacter rubripertinctus TaxID=2029981 RepID=A0A418QNV0_9BACT|nr:replication initiation protein [Hymenobacter rubripertinctus]RIY06896.1 RepB family plasmid replication initiator protein [Hymenobacter rubripertinctus]
MNLTKAENTIVFQHNHLIRTQMKMGQTEARVFVEALRCIHQSNDELPPIRIHVDAILHGERGGSAYANLKQACRDLFDKELNLEPVEGGNKKGSFILTRIVSDISLDTGTGYVTGNFAPLIKPYLLQLTKAGNFTSADIETLLTLKTPNAQRFYWLLKSYQYGKHEYEPTLESLKYILFNDEFIYPVFADFKRYVLEPIMKEFTSKEVGFMVVWNPIKTGRKVTSIHFEIPKADTLVARQLSLGLNPEIKPPTNTVVPTSKDASSTDKAATILNSLRKKWDFASWQLAIVKNAIGADEVKYTKLRDTMSAVNADWDKLENPPAVLWARLKKEFTQVKKACDAYDKA